MNNNLKVEIDKIRDNFDKKISINQRNLYLFISLPYIVKWNRGFLSIKLPQKAIADIHNMDRISTRLFGKLGTQMNSVTSKLTHYLGNKDYSKINLNKSIHLLIIVN